MYLYPTEMGKGQVEQQNNAASLTLPAVSKAAYHNAQMTNYTTDRNFTLHPPLRLSLQAYFQGDLQFGTAGFGLWNHPYSDRITGLRPPKAVWFFCAPPPNNMALAKGIPGYGWKAATFDATRWQFWAMLPAAPIGFLLMRIPMLYNALWGIGQQAIGVSEKLLDNSLLHQPHEYSIEWHRDGVMFSIDGETVHETSLSPRGALGFIAWVDNQYALVTPQGQFGWGLVDVSQDQKLILENIQIEHG